MRIGVPRELVPRITRAQSIDALSSMANLAEGSYGLYVRALDAEGNVISTSPVVTVKIDTTEPVTAPTLLSPHVGQKTGGGRHRFVAGRALVFHHGN